MAVSQFMTDFNDKQIATNQKCRDHTTFKGMSLVGIHCFSIDWKEDAFNLIISHKVEQSQTKNNHRKIRPRHLRSHKI